MIIDFHTHATGKREGTQSGSFDDFLRGMDENKIDMAVLQGRPDENDYCYELVQKYPSRLVAFAGVSPLEPNAPMKLERYVREKGFRGLKVHPPGQFFSIGDPYFIRLVRKAVELDVPILIHTGSDFIRNDRNIYGDPVVIDDIALSFPEVKIVQAHGNPLGEGPVLAGKHLNVYMDTTIVFSRMVRLIPGLGEDTINWISFGGQDGSHKILFGTDTTPTSIHRWKYGLEPILNLNISEEARTRILGGNAAELLKL